MNLRRLGIIAGSMVVSLWLTLVLYLRLPTPNLPDQSGKTDDTAFLQWTPDPSQEIVSTSGRVRTKLKPLETLESKAHLKLVNTCSSAFSIEKPASSKLNMLDIYKILKFDNPNGGSWSQGWDVKVDKTRFSRKNDKLQIYVVPHSHNDPGWLRTFEEYFEESTKHTLDKMLYNLFENKELTFIWAEMCFFNLWWNELSEENKTKLKKIVSRRQLEFVTGGWVMPDESSSHYYSILTQLIEGHQWLYQHLNYTPSNGWSIDPFGMSPTMAYFLRRTGQRNMVIQRTHYSVKKYLAQLQELEFIWRQSWDSHGATDMLCHMMPFYHYDILHTCGPEPQVCCQFDFKRISGVSNVRCPWSNVAPQAIDWDNVQSRSLVLLNQYRKKAMLYKTNVLLVPLGDDFRWTDQSEWTAQITNYKKIFDHINSNRKLNTEIKFATLDDYFRALANEVQEQRFKPSVLTGDFFTYADKQDHYWSGYFTSRPFHKAMDRELIGHLRSSHILFSLMCAELSRKHPNGLQFPFIRKLLGNLISSRRTLALFQHHDGITGTSVNQVMVDYANKLQNALTECNHVLQQSLYVLGNIHNSNLDLGSIEDNSIFYKVMNEKPIRENVLVMNKQFRERLITLFNPIIQRRVQLINIYVSSAHVMVIDETGARMESEIFPVMMRNGEISESAYQLNILVKIAPLAIRQLKIVFKESLKSSISKVFVKNTRWSFIKSTTLFGVQPIKENTSISISNGYLSIDFDKNGFASSLKLNNTSHSFRITIMKYGTARRSETSGLYLFVPDGPAKPLHIQKPFILVVKGRLQSYVEVWLEQIKHRITIYNHAGLKKYSIDVKNTVDIRQESNFELVMRFHTSINSSDLSYTDLNGFQMIRRKRFSKLPIQAHYFPLPTATFIEDGNTRMTVLSRQPLGTASLSAGEVEIMLDRRLNQDDNRGARQGCLDNVETRSSFKIIFESPDCADKQFNENPPMLTMAAHVTLHSLLHPVRSAVLLPTSQKSGISNYRIAKNQESLPCDVRLVDMPMLPTYQNSLNDESYVPTHYVSVLFHRVGIDGRFLNGIPISECPTQIQMLGHLHLQKLFGNLFPVNFNRMSISFTNQGETLFSNKSLVLKPMEIYGFLLYFETKH